MTTIEDISEPSAPYHSPRNDDNGADGSSRDDSKVSKFSLTDCSVLDLNESKNIKGIGKLL